MIRVRIGNTVDSWPTGEGWDESDGYLTIHDTSRRGIAEYAPGWDSVWMSEEHADASSE